MQSAKANNVDILLADTAGRLHTQDNLMEELKKVKRVIQKLDGNAPHEIMLVIDASIGQNALIQAQQFNKMLGVTGITVTKLDGTAKGGILFAIAQNLDIAIRFIGVGEGIDDLQTFDAKEFVQALLTPPDH
jgi:fused signal recognition particle receptor